MKITDSQGLINTEGLVVGNEVRHEVNQGVLCGTKSHE